MQRLGRYFTALVATIITVTLSLISDFILGLPTEITWLTFFLGSIITVTVTLLELRLQDSVETEINKKLQIWQMVGEIDDDELRQLALKAIDDCEKLVRSYKQGVIPAHGNAYLHNPLAQAEKYFRATFWVPNSQAIYKLEDTFAGRNYTQETVDAIGRGVDVDRIFVFNQRDIVENDDFFDLKALKILQHQAKSGVNLRITWIEDWTQFGNVAELYRDFCVIDNHKIGEQIHGVGSASHGFRILKDSKDVQRYKNFFNQIWNLGLPLDEVLKRYPPKSDSSAPVVNHRESPHNMALT